MTTDFSHLKSLDISTGHTVEFTLHQIEIDGRNPVLVVAPATSANKPYYNALLKSVGKSAQQVRSGAVKASAIDEKREEDRALYAKWVVKDWRDITDAKSKELKFSAKVCAEFLDALPDWIFDEVRAFANNPVNFTDVVDLDTTAKN